MVRSAGPVIKRTLVSFYDDQMTHHAAALTYYSLMSLFPATLLGLVFTFVLMSRRWQT
jgi:membrane protein